MNLLRAASAVNINTYTHKSMLQCSDETSSWRGFRIIQRSPYWNL